MKWIAFTVYTTDAGIELVCGALAGVGIEQVAIEESEARIDAHLRNVAPYWDFADAAALANKQGPCVRAYIADLVEQRPLLAAAREAVRGLRAFCNEEEIAPLRIEETLLDEEDWANSWKQYYKPMCVGKRLLVCPSWEEENLTEQQRKGKLLLKLDPGMVFGTGGHYTTQLCMEALEHCVQPGDHVLDIGCGSGILSIAALHLGAEKAACLDIDPVAERVVRENLLMNGLEQGRCDIHIGNILTDAALRGRIQGRYEIIVANIVADVVIALCGIVPEYLKPNGLFLCSGVIEERGEEVTAAIKEAGYTLVEILRSAEGEPLETNWLAFIAKG